MIADDHSLVRVGLASMLASEGNFDVVAEARNGAEVLDLYRQHQPDVLILDVRMPGLDGIETLRRLRAEYPAAKAIMLSTAKLEDEVAQAMDAGAYGFLSKSEQPSVLVTMIRKVADGESLFSAIKSRDVREHEPLSPRELEVLQCIALGHSSQQIADELFLSIHTVKMYVKGILSKLHTKDRAGAVAIGFAKGILKV